MGMHKRDTTTLLHLISVNPPCDAQVVSPAPKRTANPQGRAHATHQCPLAPGRAHPPASPPADADSRAHPLSAAGQPQNLAHPRSASASATLQETVLPASPGADPQGSARPPGPQPGRCARRVPCAGPASACQHAVQEVSALLHCGAVATSSASARTTLSALS